jgi:hypothetical protein
MSTESTSEGFPLASILTIMFVIAKFMGLVTWSWWWVFSPILISTGLVLAILFVVFGVTVLAGLAKAIID